MCWVEPVGAVYTKFVGEGAEPETVSTVVPKVSVNTPVLLTEIWFPFASVTVAEPPAEYGGL